jgi:hypothetical protein
MCIKVLACPTTVLGFMRNLGSRAEESVRGTTRSTDRSHAAMLQLIEAQSIKLYIPPHVVAFLHHYLREDAGDSVSTQGMRQVLRIAHSNLPVDYDVLLDDSLTLTAAYPEFEVCEVLCLLIAASMEVDFFLVNNVDYFGRIPLQRLERSSSRHVPIVDLDVLLNQFRK